METINYYVISSEDEVLADMLRYEMLLNFVGKVGSHKKFTAQIQNFNIQVHCSSALHVGGNERHLKAFKAIFHN